MHKCSWLRAGFHPVFCGAHVQMFSVQPGAKTPSISVIFDLIKISLEFITAVQNAAGCSVFRSARIVSAVHLKGVQHSASLIVILRRRGGKFKCLDKDHHHHVIIFSLSFNKFSRIKEVLV